MVKKVLTIAGSDSSGGAGIQADLKTMGALGTYGMTCICAVTAQNTEGVTAVENMPPRMVKAQLEAVYADIPPDAVKTGMLSTAEIVHTVAEFLKSHAGAPLVVDPVMVATTGAHLLEDDAIDVYKNELIPLATVITPNIPEAEVLSGLSIHNMDDMKAAAERLMQLGPKAVLVKGGHRVEDAVDVLYDGKEFRTFAGEKVKTENTHGTGCTLSSAIASFLARGQSLGEAMFYAKKYLTGALLEAQHQKIGHGCGPVSHFWNYGDDWGKL
jgi:hydroxymethylpyrimidine/phosphomethylpyrimidine kinase